MNKRRRYKAKAKRAAAAGMLKLKSWLRTPGRGSLCDVEDCWRRVTLHPVLNRSRTAYMRSGRCLYHEQGLSR